MDNDIAIIHAAFGQIRKLELIYEDTIPAKALREGFEFAGEKVLIENQAQGIFKPRQMSRGALSIKTTKPRGGGINIYNDQIKDDGFYHYSLQKGGAYSGYNKYLWQSFDLNQPLIYFHAVTPALYHALWPCFVTNIDPQKEFALISIGISSTDQQNQPVYTLLPEINSRYIVHESKLRLHQASFREAVLRAYNRRCSITGLANEKLIEAAHIIPDQEIGDKQLITNGLALSRIHHRAYDANLIGIDPNYKVHIGRELSSSNGNRFTENAFLKFEGAALNLPSNPDAKPNRDYLARRFENFQIANR